MSGDWLQEYIVLALHIDKVVRVTYGSQFVEPGEEHGREAISNSVVLSLANLVSSHGIRNGFPTWIAFFHNSDIQIIY